MEELKALHQLCALHRTKGIGVRSAKALIDFFGNVDRVFEFDKSPESLSEHVKISSLRNRLKRFFESSECREIARHEHEYMRRSSIQLMRFDHVHFPGLLNQCPDAPLALMVRGALPKAKYWVSIVGTRRNSVFGMDFCRTVIKELAPLNPVIVSGLAKGIDYFAHKTALDLGLTTVACLAHGLNQIYPKEHLALAKEIEKNGALITEFWSNAEFHPSNFLQRNRIIAGMSPVTLVLESGAKGGSLITAQFANEYHREVFAVPGSPNQTSFAGCNELIKNHQAHMLTETADIARIMGWKKPLSQQEILLNIDQTQRAILRMVNAHPYIHKDNLSRSLNLNAGILQGALLNLELSGLLLTQSGCCLLSNRGVRALAP